jgi:hypothetical protein
MGSLESEILSYFSTNTELEKCNFDYSKNDTYIIRSDDETYFVKLISYEDELMYSRLSFAKDVQNICASNNIAPFPEHLKKLSSEYILIVNEFKPNFTRFEPIDYTEDNTDRLLRAIGKTAAILHSCTAEYVQSQCYGKLPPVSTQTYNSFYEKFTENNSVDDINPIVLSNRKKEQFRQVISAYSALEDYSEPVIHVSDFTTTNVLFTEDISEGCIVDWETVSKLRRFEAIGGMLYRFNRLYSVDVSDSYGLQEICSGYNSVADQSVQLTAEDELFKRQKVVHLFKELLGFHTWSQYLSASETRSQKQFLQNEVQKLVDGI